LLKNFVRYCLAVFCESFCSSAAEEREYEANYRTRQSLLFLQHKRRYQNSQLNYLISFSFSCAAEAGGEL
jgi:hypothetical protein